MKNFLVFFVAICGFFVCNAYAHKPSDAFLRVDAADISSPKNIRLQLSLALKDLDAAIESLDENQDRQLTFAEFKSAVAEIKGLIQKDVTFYCGDNPSKLSWRIDDLSELGALEKRNDGTYVRLKAELQCATSHALQLQYRLFENIDTSHRVLITNTLGGSEVLQVGAPSENRLLLKGNADLKDIALSDEKTNASALATFLAFVVEGFVHLAIGWDHLAFILVLVLPFTLWRANNESLQIEWSSVKKLLFVISAFTAGHCLTLVLVTLNIVTVTGQWVEPTIALTIAITAALNLMPEVKAPRLWIPLIFGTVHGLGFSSVLSELEISTGSQLAALIGFNLGIELGQVAFVAIWAVLQYWLIRWKGYGRWIMNGGSSALMFAAVVLVIVRTTGS
jgi:HupE / UreJ protein